MVARRKACIVEPCSKRPADWTSLESVKGGANSATDQVGDLQLHPHEVFCQAYALAGGGYGSGASSYRSAYPRSRNYTDQRVAELASALLKKPKIQSRVKELKKRIVEIAEKEFGLTAETILQRLASIGFASLEDIVFLDPQGSPEIRLDKADRATLAGFQSLRIRRKIARKTIYESDTGQRQRIEVLIEDIQIVMPDRVKALVRLGQYFGLFQKEERPKPKHNVAARIRVAKGRHSRSSE